MSEDDDENIIVRHGDKVIRVKERFDQIEKKLFFVELGIGAILVLHLRDAEPILTWILSHL